MATDISRFILAEGAVAAHADWAYAEPSSGAGAVALLVGADAPVFRADLGANGYYGYEVMDTCRPMPDSEAGDADLSLLSYLDCCEQSFLEYQRRVAGADYGSSFQYLAFHVPFAGMVKGAHRTMMRRLAAAGPAEIEGDFQRRVVPGLIYCQRIGNIMGGTRASLPERCGSSRSRNFIEPMSGRERTVPPRATSVAIVAMAGRYPGGGTPEQFWQTLASGDDCITEIPQERWSIEDFYVADADRAVREGKSYCKWGGFIRAARERDFIGLIETLLKSAAIVPAEIRSRFRADVGVYLGARADAIRGTLPIDLANDVAAFLGLRGPSIALDANCASALAALHCACEGLMRGDCSIAIAGGISLLEREELYPPEPHRSARRDHGNNAGQYGDAISEPPGTDRDVR